jgi:sporulation protein YlmC with PRC-barrel domain
MVERERAVEVRMVQSLKLGLSVVTSDARHAGALHRVVIDEPTRTVTAIAVERPLIESGNLLKPGGWEKPRDVRVPIDLVAAADEHKLHLSLAEKDFLALPPYVIGDVPEPDGEWNPPPEFRAEDVSMRVGTLLGGGLYEPPHDEVENRSPTERHLSHGAAVWRREPHTHLGDLDRVLMDEASHQVTVLVVRRGLVFGHDVALPMRYVVDLLDDLVHVDIPEAEWDALEEYRPGS